MALMRLFTEHPASLGETYPQHMRAALSFAGPLAKAAGAALVHAVFPFLFVTTASDTIKTLHGRMTRRCAACPKGMLHHPELFAGAAGSRRQDASPAPVLAFDPVI